jgi:hypothetical protein
MLLIKRVEPIEVKKCFYISDYIAHHGLKKDEALPPLSKVDFKKRLTKAINKANKLSEKDFDSFIGKDFKRRIKAYNLMNWYLGTAEINEIGVWTKAGSLPKRWTRGSLTETAKYVKTALLKKRSPVPDRARNAIPGVIKLADLIKNEKYLLPIILPGGTLDKEPLKKMLGNIDDGCMRSIALAISGERQLQAYIGVKMNIFERIRHFWENIWHSIS